MAAHKKPALVLRGTARKRRPTGRPTLYTEALATEICERIASGESLRQICKRKGCPCMGTILKWLMDEDKPSFVANYTRAREMQAELYSHQIAEIADETKTASSREQMESARIRIDARKWLAGKLRPKKYGDKIQTEISGTLGVTRAQEMTDDELAAIAAAGRDRTADPA